MLATYQLSLTGTPNLTNGRVTLVVAYNILIYMKNCFVSERVFIDREHLYTERISSRISRVAGVANG